MPTTGAGNSRRKASKPRPGLENVAERAELVELLLKAAQIEHEVVCQYLFAAVSIKQHLAEGGVTYGHLEEMRRWKGTLMLVARQEMEHLGIVMNLLTKIGEAPEFSHPEFPSPPSVLPDGQESRLEPFGRRAVLRFVCLEMPREPTYEDKAYLEEQIDGFTPASFDAIYRHYEQIKRLLERIDPADLFIGPSRAEFLTGGDSVAVAARGRVLPGPEPIPTTFYDVTIPAITGRDEALAAIHQIVEEGEGAGKHNDTSHFSRFLAMLRQLNEMQSADPHFEPARKVVPDPSTSGRPGCTRITNPATVPVSQLFDESYALVLELLLRIFACTDESEDEIEALVRITFSPMMTTVIRPLAEILTELPASRGDRPERAGPSFSLSRRVRFLPHQKAARRSVDMQLAALENIARNVAADDRNPESVRARLVHVSEQLTSIRKTYERKLDVRVAP
jgi:rubrerythrin